MSELPTHTQTVTQTQTTTLVSPYIRYDPLYIKTIPGIIKIVCVILSLIGFICIECSDFSSHSRGAFFNFVALVAFWFSAIMLSFYIFHVCEKFHKIPWLKVELYSYAVWTLMYMLAASLAAATNSAAFQAAAFFGFCCMIAYGIDTFLKYKAVQSGEIAQGTRNVQQQQTVATVDTY